MTPRVSIIVPIYNVEAYLKACLDSVMAQTVSDWECILVNDCSTDSSPSIAATYLTDPRFRLLHTPRNSGQSAARNIGLDLARGHWIAFLDSDDTLPPDSLRPLLTGPDADIIIGQDHDYASGFRVLTGHEAALRSLYQTTHPAPVTCSPWGRLFRREHFEERRFTPGIIYEDLELITHLLADARTVAVTGRKVYNYNRRPGSTTTTFSPRRLDVLAVTERLERDFTSDPDLLRAARDRRFAANFNMLLLLRRNGLGRSPQAEACCTQLRRLRASTLLNPRVRLKNRLGAIAAYLL